MKKIFPFFLAITLIVPLTAFSQMGWIQVYNGGSSNQNVINVAFTNQLTGYATGGSQSLGNVLKTTNGGQSWNTVFSGNTAFQSLSFVNDLTGFVIGGYNPSSLIYRTINGGQTWSQQVSGTSYCYFDSYFFNASTGLIVGDWGSIRKTTNGGDTWFGCNSGTSDYLYSIHFVNQNTGFAVGSVGQIMKTIDGGNNWSQLIQIGSWLRSVNFLNDNTGYVVGNGGRLMKTTDCGGSWAILSLGLIYDLNNIFIVDQNLMFIVGVNGFVLKTINGGINWTQQNVGSSNTLLGVYFQNSQTGFTCGSNASIYKTQTAGELLPLPTLISPPDNSNNVPLTPALVWSNISGVNNYLVQVSPLSNFSTITDSATVILNQRIIPAGKLQANTTYFWRVRATNGLGTGPWTDVWNFGTTSVGINQISTEIPSKFILYQNHPNPFNPVTNIKFDVAKSLLVKLVVFDVLGREVETLVNKELNAGKYESNWNAVNYNSGIYFIKLTAGDFTEIKRVALVK